MLGLFAGYGLLTGLPGLLVGAFVGPHILLPALGLLLVAAAAGGLIVGLRRPTPSIRRGVTGLSLVMTIAACTTLWSARSQDVVIVGICGFVAACAAALFTRSFQIPCGPVAAGVED